MIPLVGRGKLVVQIGTTRSPSFLLSHMILYLKYSSGTNTRSY